MATMDTPNTPYDDVNVTSALTPAVTTGEIPILAERRLSPEEVAMIESLPEGSALLIAQSGPNSGARFLLDGEETLAGRHVKANIFLDDVTVSRRHAIFIRDGKEFHVRDSGSLNGTYVNRERIEDAVLRTGDEVQIGKFRLVFYGAQGMV